MSVLVGPWKPADSNEQFTPKETRLMHEQHLVSSEPFRRPLCVATAEAHVWQGHESVGGFDMDRFKPISVPYNPFTTCKRCVRRSTAVNVSFDPSSGTYKVSPPETSDHFCKCGASISLSYEQCYRCYRNALLRSCLHSDEKILTAKWGGVCFTCGEDFYRGGKIIWSLESRVASHLMCVFSVREEKVENEMVKFFKFADHVAVVTDEPSEAAFNKAYTDAQLQIIREDTLGEDLPFFLLKANARSHEIACKYRGYKSDVKEERLFSSRDYRSRPLRVGL